MAAEESLAGQSVSRRDPVARVLRTIIPGPSSKSLSRVADEPTEEELGHCVSGAPSSSRATAVSARAAAVVKRAAAVAVARGVHGRPERLQCKH